MCHAILSIVLFSHFGCYFNKRLPACLSVLACADRQASRWLERDRHQDVQRANGTQLKT